MPGYINNIQINEKIKNGNELMQVNRPEIKTYEVNMTKMYNYYEKGKKLDDILVQVANNTYNKIKVIPDRQIREGILADIVCSLYNKNLPYKDYALYDEFHDDMIIVYQVINTASDIPFDIGLLRKDIFNEFDITKDELYYCARANTLRLMRPIIINNKDKKSKIHIPLSYESSENDIDNIFYNTNIKELIIKNEFGSFGATSIIFPSVLKRIADIMQGDYYILPKTVDFVMVIKDESSLYEYMQLINYSNVRGPLLSKHVYLYDSIKEQLKKFI